MAATQEPKTFVPSGTLLLALALALVVIGGLIAHWNPRRPWGVIGSIAGLAGIVVMLARDRIAEHGDSYKNKLNSSALMDKDGRLQARLIAPFIYAIGIPLVLLGAWFQLLGNPPDPSMLRIERFPDGLIHAVSNSRDYNLDLSTLDKTVHIVEANQNNIADAIKQLSYPELLVFNCSRAAAKECSCPEGYMRVKDNGKWDLNSAAGGDAISLCFKNRPYAHITQ
jgi:hypothetical protein